MVIFHSYVSLPSRVTSRKPRPKRARPGPRHVQRIDLEDPAVELLRRHRRQQGAQVEGAKRQRRGAGVQALPGFLSHHCFGYWKILVDMFLVCFLIVLYIWVCCIFLFLIFYIAYHIENSIYYRILYLIQSGWYMLISQIIPHTLWPSVLEMTAGIQYAWYAEHLDVVVSALAFFLFTIAMAQALESQDMMFFTPVICAV